MTYTKEQKERIIAERMTQFVYDLKEDFGILAKFNIAPEPTAVNPPDGPCPCPCKETTATPPVEDCRSDRSGFAEEDCDGPEETYCDTPVVDCDEPFFRVGDVVNFRGNHPCDMNVVFVHYNASVATCAWFSPDGHLIARHIDFACLVLSEDFIEDRSDIE